MDKNSKHGRRYSPEEKAAAVPMVRSLRAGLGTNRGTAQRVALQLGYGASRFGRGRGKRIFTMGLLVVSLPTGRRHRRLEQKIVN
jgi:hypothetical protein